MPLCPSPDSCVACFDAHLGPSFLRLTYPSTVRLAGLSLSSGARVVARPRVAAGMVSRRFARSAVSSNLRMRLHPTTIPSRFPSPSIPLAGLVARVAVFDSVLLPTSSTVSAVIADVASDLSSPITMRPETPNTALQRTAALAFSYRSAGERSTGSVTACAPAMKPSTCRAFASRRSAHTRVSGLRSLSFWSLGLSALH